LPWKGGSSSSGWRLVRYSQCRFGAAGDVRDIPGEPGRRLQSCPCERRVLGEEDRGV